MGQVINVLIADDRPCGRAALQTMLDAQPTLRLVGAVADMAAVAPAAISLGAEIVIIDAALIDVDDHRVIHQLRCAAGREIRVVVQSQSGHENRVQTVLASGASGFLLRDAAADEVVFAIHAVASGGMFVAPAVLARVVGRPAAPWDDAPSANNLTARELEVIRLIAGGLSNREIAHSLRVAETTVRTHVAHLLTKLDLRNRVEIAAFAYQTQITLRTRPAAMGLAG